MVMRYYEMGDLRQFLEKNGEKLTWKDILDILWHISGTLADIHRIGVLHRDLHSGNIYQRYNSRYNIYVSYVGDLGLCTPANKSLKSSEIYGVMPYVAPEVLRKEPYTSKSEIYSFGIIMSEIAAGQSPFSDRKHDHELASDICRGVRLAFPRETPKCYVDLMKECWDKDPLKRPTAEVIKEKFTKWRDDYELGGEISKIFKEAQIRTASEAYPLNPGAVYTSRPLMKYFSNKYKLADPEEFDFIDDLDNPETS